MSVSAPHEIKPIFLFSMPRSGSTLCMRIMGVHEEIATVYEPFILLPLFYALNDKGVYGEYNHEHTAWAIRDFVRQLPNGVNDYYEEVRRLTLNLYRKAAGDNPGYFLDKTPNYCWIVEDVIRLFPDAKFVFLWRNPLSVVSSLMKSWNGGRWNLYEHDSYLFEGLANLISSFQKHADISVSIRYEDIVTDPEPEWQRVFDYLGIHFDPRQLSRFVDLKPDARLAGQLDINQYNAISQEPLTKWSTTLANPFRKAWCTRYIHWIGSARLASMGYNKDELLRDLDQLPTQLDYLASDAWNVPYGMIYRLIEGRLIKQKIKDLISGRRIYIHK